MLALRVSCVLKCGGLLQRSLSCSSRGAGVVVCNRGRLGEVVSEPSVD